jgi:anti-anti-sigma factor
MITRAKVREGAAERRIAFVQLPETLDVSNDRMVLDLLLSALAGRPTVLVADGTGTAFCDCAAISALVCAHRSAAAAGAQLRVVTASGAVRRVIRLTTAYEVLDVYQTMDEALADMTGQGAARRFGAQAPASETA